ncbi:nuclear transport factor 2 family protein [Draconibacterium orientale]|uniref:nuclear transport factor 2 family protein n=1 Tax=Draconibacterium orientale TaxID=1168034 RepID=UPI0029C04CAD|nr:nuclear transport factor 2 family protein [Draconibacterium orientale]
MKNLLTTLVLLAIVSLTYAQKMDNKNLEQRVNAIEDKMAIKEVVDVFSNLADTKEIDKQVLLFTEDGVVESITNGQSNVLKGREQLKQAFSGFLSNFQIVYHQKGQQTIDELTENTAKTTSYCRVILVGELDGKQMKTTLYTIYNDSFVKQDDKWLIAHRTSNFVWREVEEVN